MIGRELLFSEGAGWMSTHKRWRLGSRWCRALILVQPGLLAATSCPFSVRWRRQRERDRVETQRERQRKGLPAEKNWKRNRRKGREGRGQKESLVWKLFGDCTDTRVTQQQGRKRRVGEHWRRGWETGVVKLLSSLSVFVPGYCLFTAMADIWVFGRDNRSVTELQRLEATHQCLADETRLAQRKQIVYEWRDEKKIILYFPSCWWRVSR